MWQSRIGKKHAKWKNTFLISTFIKKSESGAEQGQKIPLMELKTITVLELEYKILVMYDFQIAA